MSAQLPPEPGPAGAEPPPPPVDGPRVVRRSRSDRVIAGVCGGVGRYLGVDPVLLRIAFIILALANGLGLIAYVVAWVAIPEERPGQPVGPVPEPRRETGRLVLGGSLVVLGLVLLLDRLAPAWTSCSGRSRWSPSGSRSCWWGCGDDHRADADRPTGRPADRAGAAGRPAGQRDRRGPATATVLVGALLVLVGIGWLLDAAGVEVPWRAVLPAALIAVGLACVAGAFRGRQHALMVVGVALTVVLSVAVAADWDLDVPLAGGVGDRTERPTTPADLTGYELGVGNLLLDLRQLQVPPGTTTVEARVGVGELVVELPDGVSVEVMASAGLGEVQVLGQQEGGFGSRVDAVGLGGGDRRLQLDARVGLGQVRVER